MLSTWNLIYFLSLRPNDEVEAFVDGLWWSGVIVKAGGAVQVDISC